MGGSIIIIGAGIAGLAAGCYARMNGYDTRIFEMHDKPGGLCTSWRRKDYTIDGCIHWLVGTRPGSGLNRVWMELGALQGKEIVNHEEFLHFEGMDGGVFSLFTDANRLERHMKELSPGDSSVIEDLTGGIRALSRVDMTPGKPGEIASLPDRLRMLPRMLPMLRPMIKWGKTPLKAFGERFTDPLLREAFTRIYDLPDFPMFGLLFNMAVLNNRDAGYPIGGSLEFSRSIERRYLGLGGEVSYRSRVEKILVEGDRARGIRLSDGSEHRADIVISAADSHATIFDMLEGRYIDAKVRKRFDTMPIFEPMIQVSLGVAADLSGEPPALSIPLSDPIEVAGKTRDRLDAVNMSFDPTLAPGGKTVMTVSFLSNYPFWEKLRADEDRYRAEKDSIGAAVLSRLEERFPVIRGKVEVMDVATPVTFRRYTNNWQGSFEGWLLTTDNMSSASKGFDRTLPGLEGLYMVGQWLVPGGGLPTAAQTAREAVQVICHRDGLSFTANEP